MDTTKLGLFAKRTGLVLAAAATVLVASTATAQAAVAAKITFAAHPSGFNELIYSTGSDDAQLEVTRSGNMVIFKDRGGARILSGTDRCHDNVLAGQVQCSATGLNNIKIIGSDGPDSFLNRSGIASHMLGLDGEDGMQGGAAVFDKMEGGPGNDFIYTYDGGPNTYDYVDCGAGDDDRWFNDSTDGGANCEDVNTTDV